ncbi:Cold shock protein, CspA family [Gemmobacter aquatilis]|uniref:Cold shock protein, CspA family n=1 Tax=Gemmobacter aquatilis TaxID=933059 RepID=A0A1H8MNT6_9RHOB|nr:SIR2 family protein [Gemmobacter aquatilis]SEO19111.1 Cold shock protein, CspA family [Gemmobacter aquatilis]
MTAPAKSKLRVNLPHVLSEAVKEGRAVIVFGAGSSMECRSSDGRRPPSADELRDHLAAKFLGTKNEKRDLATVAEMAINAGAGEPQVFDEVARQFKDFSTSKSHERLADFRWRGLATTNYDRFIELGYALNTTALQTCIPFVKNDEPYEDRLRDERSPVPLLKLHGCLDHRLDRDVPLVLSNEHYSTYEKGRDLLFNRLRDWAQSSVLIFIGYRIADPHIRDLIYKIDPARRPRWYMVSPGGDEHDVRFWDKKGVEVISATFSGFMDALDNSVPQLFRALAPPADTGNRPYLKHLKNGHPSDQLVEALDRDFDYVHAAMPFDEVSAEGFYSGYDHGWSGIIRKYDFSRRLGEDLLYAAVDVDPETATVRMFVLEGAAGSGKTIALRRAAFDAATALDQFVLWLKPSGILRAEIIEELWSLSGLRLFLFVDHVSLHAEELERALQSLKRKNVQVTVVVSEREAEWAAYCSGLDAFQPTTSTLRRLSEREVENLVDLLARHRCLGQLTNLSRAEQIEAFLSKDRADRQLLVALHELTRGKPFEQIILDEFNRVLGDAARSLYLDIATMHQFGVTARAGAISRISGIRFDDFKSEFIKPLTDIVRVAADRFTGDQGYETRHSHVAEIVFRAVCETDEARSVQLSRIVGGLDPGYSSDRRVLENICKGRNIAKSFSSIEHARKIFEIASAALPESAFLFQQAAILEMHHAKGSLDAAEELAQTARTLDQNNHIYVHTLAEVSRRKANIAVSQVRAEQLRAQSRRFLNEITINDPRKSLTFCNLLIDEVIDLLRALPEDPKEYMIIEFDRKVAESKDRLDKARREFPGEAEFPAAEGRLWQRLGDEARAKRVLQQATSLKSQNAGVFLRLAQVQATGGEIEVSIDTLRSGLQRFPSDKQLHLALALRLIEYNRTTSPEIDGHFGASYGVGDHALDARFFHACYLFWAGKIEECRRLFDEVSARSSADYRKRPNPEEGIIDQFIAQQTGSVASVRDDYFFIQSGCYPRQIFAHMSALNGIDISELSSGKQVRFRVRFNRRGPVASSIIIS